MTALVMVIIFAIKFKEQSKFCASVPETPIQEIEFEASEISLGTVITILMFCS